MSSAADQSRIELFAILGTALAIIGITVAMFMNLGNKIDNFQAEMRDVYGRVSTLEERTK